MLVLSRRKNESVRITAPPGGIPGGTVIEVMVSEIRSSGRGSKVRLGFTAPVEIQIDRSEIAESKSTQPKPA